MQDQFGRQSVVAYVGGLGAADGAGADETSVVDAPALADDSDAAAAAAGDPAFTPASKKYEVVAPIGQGGMGEVMLVVDHDLRRDVAMKVLRDSHATQPVMKRKFVAEAQATSQLEHPGIPPVHDIGVDTDGRVWFTMKVVRGRTLTEVLHDLLLGRKETRAEYNLHKLVSVMERIAEALHFAHEKGVIHRDLKPDNVMLGEFGEVHVMDWGIAKVETSVDDVDDEFADTEGDVRTLDTDDPLLTQVGTIKGTIPYMSPEQARGETLDRSSDVYALGALLYEVLTLQPAFEGTGAGLLARVRAGSCAPVRTRNARRAVPEDLAELVERAMSASPAARPATADAFAVELRGWLDGRAEKARRHREAEALAAQGKTAIAHYTQLQRELGMAEEAVEAESGKYQSWQPIAETQPLIEAQNLVEKLRTDEALAFADGQRLLDAALLAEEGNATARTALAELWKGRLEKAEREGQRPDAAYAETMVRRYDDGRLAAFLAGDGVLELASEPAGAEVTLERFEEEHGVLVPAAARVLGETPLARVALPMGSYLCTLRLAGYRQVRYPVHITRGQRWQGSVRMRTEEELGEEFALVAAGAFIYGEGKETTTKELPDFLIRRTPVTFGEWGAFLSAVEAEEGVEAAAKLIPAVKGDGAYMERGEGGVYRVLSNIVEGLSRERCIAAFGETFEESIAVMGISWHDANAYCAWKTRVTGNDWRLPTEEEREKAARGVDGRRFTWGNLEHASLCKNGGSRNERNQPEPVGAFPTATSVYGMVDAAGSFFEWTSSLYEPHVQASDSRVYRGGSWNSLVGSARAANRVRDTPEYRISHIGFRPARSVTT